MGMLRHTHLKSLMANLLMLYLQTVEIGLVNVVIQFIITSERLKPSNKEQVAAPVTLDLLILQHLRLYALMVVHHHR